MVKKNNNNKEAQRNQMAHIRNGKKVAHTKKQKQKKNK